MRKLPPLERFIRRSRVYRGRVARMVTQAKLKHPCVFMHVPKCGGTSLSEGLYSLVPLNLKIGILDSPSIRRAMALQYYDRDEDKTFHDEGDEVVRISEFRERLLLMHLAHECHLIHGHFLFSETAYRHFGDRYKFVTILRDPIVRTISSYRMATRTGHFEGDFDAFLDSPKGRRMILHNLRYFSGIPDVAPGEEAAALEKAKTNLARFAVVGFIEEQADFVRHFREVFGRAPSLGHYNRARDEGVELTAPQRKKLEALSWPDLEIDALARKRWGCAPRPG
jgi:Sulfotransferase family.